MALASCRLRSLKKFITRSNLTTDIPWTDSGGSGANAAYSSVSDVELAFNNARRQEEVQLELTSGQLGVLDLPGQSIWDGLTDQQKALILINAERQARANMLPNVLGLPLAGIEENLNKTAQAYAELLVTTNTTGHFQPSNDPLIDNPDIRIDNTPAIGSCTQSISRAENLQLHWTRATSVLLPIERAIYTWLYVDARSAWGHREAVLLQDTAVDGSPSGFTNDLSSNLHEGFLGIGHAGAIGYNPLGLSGQIYGEMVVMNIVDPTPAAGCPTDAGLAEAMVTASLGRGAILTPGASLTMTLQVTNTGATLLTDLVISQTFAVDFLTFVSASLPPDVVDVVAGRLIWRQVEGTLPMAMLNPGQSATIQLEFAALATLPANGSAVLTSEAGAQGVWGGPVAPLMVHTTLSVVEANPDSATTAEDQSLLVDVLANDSASLTLSAVSAPAHGVATIEDGRIRYTPLPDYNGVDSFFYTVTTPTGDSLEILVTITVTPVNDAPEFLSAPLLGPIPAGVLLTHEILIADPDLADVITIAYSEGPAWLTLTDHGNGTAILSGTPPDGTTGPQSITLTASDSAGASTVQHFVFTVGPAQAKLYLPIVRQ